MNRIESPWVVVLAGGNGERLRTITSSPSGRSIPKQFCRLNGKDSMLGVTLARARGLTTTSQIVVVVVDEHRMWWEEELTVVHSVNILVQSRNRGTGLALLRALLHVRGSDPDACVVVLPSDHVVDDETVLNKAILEAVDEARRSKGHMVLIGAPSSAPDPSLGWIVPDRASSRHIRAVDSFVEKPSVAVASECVRRGAFRNTLMLAATLEALLGAYAHAMPEWVHETETDDDAFDARTRAPLTIHSDLPTMDLGRDVLQRSTQWLRVLPLPECGWTDIGTPERLEAWWRRHPIALEDVRHSGVLSPVSLMPPAARPGIEMGLRAEELVAATGTDGPPCDGAA